MQQVETKPKVPTRKKMPPEKEFKIKVFQKSKNQPKTRATMASLPRRLSVHGLNS